MVDAPAGLFQIVGHAAGAGRLLHAVLELLLALTEEVKQAADLALAFARVLDTVVGRVVVVVLRELARLSEQRVLLAVCAGLFGGSLLLFVELFVGLLLFGGLRMFLGLVVESYFSFGLVSWR